MSTHFDVVIVGSGFGGSVSALRLTEKGYRVAVLEAGAQFADADFPRTSWDLRRYLFAPRLGMRGIQRIHVLDDVIVLAGAGVGGGSLNYANTLYEPHHSYYDDPQWAHICDWRAELAPHFATAKRYLGVVENPYVSNSDRAMQRAAEALGVGHTFRLTPVGVYFGDGPGVTRPDPFFGGDGPARSGCTQCGECMTGCRHNAKNTLPKNYLGLAERLGAAVFPLTTVQALQPRADGGWRVRTRRTGMLGRRGPTFTADQVVLAAGTYGTQRLLHRMRDQGVLAQLSTRLGDATRTNSESLVGAVMPAGSDLDFTDGSAITSSFFIDAHTHVEPVRYGRGSNAMAFLQTLMTDGATAAESRRQWLRRAVRSPRTLLRLADPRRWSERSIIALVMQDLDNALQLRGHRGRLGWRLRSANHATTPIPLHVDGGNAVARLLAQQNGGVAAGTVGELFGRPLTAHFTGGCVIGDSPEAGVIDAYHRVWNYPTLHIVDGSTITANLGVNPSLTITAQAERAMSYWPANGAPDPRPTQPTPG